MMTEMTITIIIGLMIPLLGTMVGSAFVFFMKDEMSEQLQKSLLGFASGVMVAASVWSLLIPAMDMEAGCGKWSVVPAAGGTMRKNLRRSMRYFGYAPIETTCNFLNSFFKSLSEIEE